MCLFLFFKQKTAYELRISDWSSDVCSSDLVRREAAGASRCLRSPPERRSTYAHCWFARRWERPVAAAASRGWRGSARQPAPPADRSTARPPRSEERRVGKACIRTGKSRWSPSTQQKKRQIEIQKTIN